MNEPELFYVQRKVDGNWENYPDHPFPYERASTHMNLGRQDHGGGEWRVTPAGPRQPRDEREAEYLSNLRAVSKHIRPATRQEYADWMRIFKANGGRPGNHRHITFASGNIDAANRTQIYVALRSFEMRRFCGADSFKIIVPRGVTISGDRGHCNLLFDNGTTSDAATVWEYGDL